MPRITVLMPVYNCKQHIEESVNSILNQTFSDFEFLIIDGCSKDGTYEYLQSLYDPRITLIRETHKSGIVNSLNMGIEMAKGEYIARMDADDISTKDRFRIQLNAISEQNIDILGGFMRYIGGRFDGKIEEYPITDSDIRFRMLRGCAIAHPTVFVKANVLKENLYKAQINNISNLLGFPEDYELWTRLAIKGFKFGNVPEVLLLYRVNPSQISQTYTKRLQKFTIHTAANYGYLQYGIPMQQTSHFGFGVKSEEQNGKLTEYVIKLIMIAKESGVSKRWIQIILVEIAARMPPSAKDSLNLLLKLLSKHIYIMEIRLLVALVFKMFPHIENVKVRNKGLAIARHLGFRI